MAICECGSQHQKGEYCYRERRKEEKAEQNWAAMNYKTFKLLFVQWREPQRFEAMESICIKGLKF